MSETAEQHRRDSPRSVACAVITVSDTRTWDTDTGGRDLAERLGQAGHAVVVRELIPDDPVRLASLVTSLAQREDVDAVLITGGTGIARRDRTCETLTGLFSKQIPGYGELFRMLSYEEIGAAAMLSRAVGGLLGRTVVLTMPGSPAAVRLATEKLILPELGHLAREARR